MRLLLPLLLFTLNSFAQKDTILNYSKMIDISFWTVAEDSADMKVDTLDLKGAFMPIHIYYTDSVVYIPGVDTLQVLRIEIDGEIVRLSCQKDLSYLDYTQDSIAYKNAPMPVQLMWREDFLTLDYPFIDGIGRTVLFYIKSEQISVSDGVQ